MPLVWRSSLPLRKKLDATFHLGANLAFPVTVFMTLAALPVMLLRLQGRGAGGVATAIDTVLFALVAATQFVFYAIATREVHANWKQRLKYIPFFPLVGVGLAVNNARGVLEALFGHRTEFVRTPKLGVLGRDRDTAAARSRAYVGVKDVAQPTFEAVFGAYYVAMAFLQARHGLLGTALVTAVLSAGLFTMSGATFRSVLARRARPRPARVPDAVLPAGG
jgi:hypothetical protein